MKLSINIIEQKLYMGLKLHNKFIDELIVPIDRNLDEQLITGLDKLFRRNRLDRLSLKTVKIARNIDKNGTSYRIITAFKKGLSRPQ